MVTATARPAGTVLAFMIPPLPPLPPWQVFVPGEPAGPGTDTGPVTATAHESPGSLRFSVILSRSMPSTTGVPDGTAIQSGVPWTIGLAGVFAGQQRL